MYVFNLSAPIATSLDIDSDIRVYLTKEELKQIVNITIDINENKTLLSYDDYFSQHPNQTQAVSSAVATVTICLLLHCYVHYAGGDVF